MKLACPVEVVLELFHILDCVFLFYFFFLPAVMDGIESTISDIKVSDITIRNYVISHVSLILQCLVSLQRSIRSGHRPAI